MHTQDVIIDCRITPQEIHRHLLSLVVNLAKGDLQRSLDFLNIFDFLEGGADTSMHTKDLIVGALIIHDSCQGEVLKHVIKLLENTIGVVDIFSETSIALLAQSQVLIYVAIFVVTAQHEDLFGVFELASHQEADNLQTLAAFVNIIAQEEVVEATNVT